MPKKKAGLEKVKTEVGYDSVLSGVVNLLEAARRAAARSVNAIMTATYWEIGRRIVEIEQNSENRSDYYGKEIVDRLAQDLTQKFGRGFGRRNLFQMRAFYFAYREIVQTASAQSGLTGIAKQFRLPWSHYVTLLSVKNENAREFYETEALRGGWTIRRLKRQIDSRFYERTLLSKNKAAMLRKSAEPQPEDAVTPDEEIKDAFVLEFLGLKDEYSESELEAAILAHLENFLLELGADFAFVGRQRRLRVGDEWYRVDLVFYHRRLRCLVIIDLKLGKITHADIGQMLLYTNYAAEYWRVEGENPPIGLILCDRKNDALAHYTLDALPNKILAAEYKLLLPDEQILIDEINRTRQTLLARKS